MTSLFKQHQHIETHTEEKRKEKRREPKRPEKRRERAEDRRKGSKRSGGKREERREDQRTRERGNKQLWRHVHVVEVRDKLAESQRISRRKNNKGLSMVTIATGQ